MRRRKMRTLARRYWRTTALDVAFWTSQDCMNHERIYSMPAAHRGAMIRALVDAAPSADQVREIGVGPFEQYFHDRSDSALRPFVDARLSELELELTLSGVWVSILEDCLALGHRIPLPAHCVAHLTDPDPESREARFADLAERWSAHRLPRSRYAGGQK